MIGDEVAVGLVVDEEDVGVEAEVRNIESKKQCINVNIGPPERN